MSGFNTGEKPFAKHNEIIEFRRKVYQSSCFSNLKKKTKKKTVRLEWVQLNKMEYNTKAHGHPTEPDRCCHRKQDIFRWDREKLGVLCCFSTGEERAQSKRRTAASLLLCCRGSSQTTPARDLPKSLIQLHLIYTHAQATALRQGRAVHFHHIRLR